MDMKCSPIVKSLVSAVQSPQICHLFSRECFRWKIHLGNQALFWEDVWPLNKSLSSAYPDLYRYSLTQHSSVSTVVNMWLQDEFMSPLWHTSSSHNSVAQMRHISSLLHGIKFSSKEDVLLWTPTNGRFTTKDGYSILVNSNPSRHHSNVFGVGYGISKRLEKYWLSRGS